MTRREGCAEEHEGEGEGQEAPGGGVAHRVLRDGQSEMGKVGRAGEIPLSSCFHTICNFLPLPRRASLSASPLIPFLPLHHPDVTI